ncbi:MAG: PAS domain S-box protein [Sphingobacteriaceae bacterium]|nr:MAG: PAS domain S-box protein [Sphingobacteriaceae bacterium]
MHLENLPVNDPERLAALNSYQILDTLSEKDFDDLTALAAAICQVPIALISLVDDKRQWFKSHKGLSIHETPVEQSFCAHAIFSADEIMVVKDAAADERFTDNPLVTGGPQITFYAGVPLINEDGYALGTLCVIDSEHKQLNQEQESGLKIVARMVMDKLELRRKVLALETVNQDLQKAQYALLDLNTELFRSEGKLLLAVDSADMGTWSADVLNDGLTLSKRARNMHGFTEDQPITLSESFKLIHPEYRELVQSTMRRAISEDKPFTEQYIIDPADGSKSVWIRTTGKATYYFDGKIKTISGTMLDITQQKKDEQLKNDFIAMVSHELKTPLTSLNGYMQMLELMASKNGDQPGLATLKKANKQVGKMTSLVNGFLDVSRLEAGKIYIDKARFDLAELIKEAEDESLAAIASHKVVFAPVEKTIVEADRDKIGQVITNLLNNAVKYSPPESVIRVACVTFGDCAQISVQDEGMGIAPNDLNHLFDRFYRVENRQTEKIKGFGIGLYLCSEIVQRHQGKIWVQSALGQGSTFFFNLPVITDKQFYN